MNGNCHFLYSATVCAMISVNINIISPALPNIGTDTTSVVLLLMGGILGGLLPDMDNPKSSIAKISVPISTIICKIGKLFGRGGKYHRGILHDPFIYIVGLVLSYLFFPQLIGLFIGGVSHIYLDFFNPVGLPLLFGTKYVHIAEINSGSNAAKVFTYLSSAMVLLIGIGIYHGYFLPLIAF